MNDLPIDEIGLNDDQSELLQFVPKSSLHKGQPIKYFPKYGHSAKPLGMMALGMAITWSSLLT